MQYTSHVFMPNCKQLFRAHTVTLFQNIYDSNKTMLMNQTINRARYSHALFSSKAKDFGCFFMPVIKNIPRPLQQSKFGEARIVKKISSLIFNTYSTVHAHLALFLFLICLVEVWPRNIGKRRRKKISHTLLYSVTMLNNIEKPCQRWKKGAPNLNIDLEFFVQSVHAISCPQLDRFKSRQFRRSKIIRLSNIFSSA